MCLILSRPKTISPSFCEVLTSCTFNSEIWLIANNSSSRIYLQHWRHNWLLSESFLLAKRISNLGLSCHDAGDLRDGEHFGLCSTPWNKNSVHLVILKPSCFRWVCHLVGGQAGPLGSKKKARATPTFFFFLGLILIFFYMGVPGDRLCTTY